MLGLSGGARHPNSLPGADLLGYPIWCWRSAPPRVPFGTLQPGPKAATAWVSRDAYFLIDELTRDIAIITRCNFCFVTWMEPSSIEPLPFVNGLSGLPRPMAKMPRLSIGSSVRTKTGTSRGRSSSPRLLERLELAEPLDDVLRRDREDFPGFFRPDTSVSGALREARSAGWAIAVVTNGDSNQVRKKLVAAEITDLVDAVCISANEDAWKPDPRLLHIAAERCGSSFEGAWIIGVTQFGDTTINAFRFSVLSRLFSCPVFTSEWEHRCSGKSGVELSPVPSLLQISNNVTHVLGDQAGVSPDRAGAWAPGTPMPTCAPRRARAR